MIKVYTKARCPKCIEMTNWLSKRNFKFTIIEGKHAYERTIEDVAKEFGILTAPVVKIGTKGYSDEDAKIQLGYGDKNDY